METLDNHGCAHIAYADDNTVNLLRAANQSSGPCLGDRGGRDVWARDLKEGVRQ